MDTSAASTSTAAYPKNNYPYDIFINHRGPDTKKNFASHLYRRLLLHGFQAFWDQEEMQQGDNIDSQIIAAIESASIHVAIFSPGYAESRWCLEELSLMIKTSATIIPVFYNVEPSELKRPTRGQNGLYAQALRDHEEKRRYDSATLKNWRDALSRVADKSGFELAACNGDEGELLEKVVERVLKKVKGLGLDVAKYPTGLDMKVKDFENTVLLQQQQRSGKPRIFGIWGLGGVGKTTLAKRLFNSYNSNYRSSCFLNDVRDHATRGLLNLLQSRLLKDLTRLEKVIYSIDEGMQMLKKPLSSSHALIILDDVDDLNQVDTLLPDVQTVACSDSLILITSRNRAVLRSSGVEEKSIYKLNGLNRQHSRELFCSLAFSQQHPLPGFESLVKKFIEACDGLPLSLKVFGALLYGRHDKSDWQNELDALQQTLPSAIQQKLKISYDTLNEEEQHIFLDIACFLIGEHRDKALRIWNGSGWKGLLGLQNLLDKCLVELDSRNNILMHDHLRDMGRDIASDSNLQLPRRVRCSTQDIGDLLQQSNTEQVLTSVRGIMVASSKPRPQFDHYYYFIYDSEFIRDVFFRSKMSWFKRSSHELLGNPGMKLLNSLRNTRHRCLGVGLLDVEDGHVEHILRKVQSPNLIWLRWFKCPYTFLPSWIPNKNLTVLEVGGRLLKSLWQDESQVPLQLRELQIYAPLSNIPKSIGQLKHLERIVVYFLSRRFNLKTLPEELCHLQSLKTLVLRHSNLKSLPDSFGDLINLEHLDLDSNCNLEMLPISFGNLVKLKYLNLSLCKNLTISAKTLGGIRSLDYLDLLHCFKIEVLPPQVAHQRSLVELHLSCTDFKEWPSASGDPSDLEILTIERSKLCSLPPSLGELKNLKILMLFSCRSLEYLPDSVGLLTQLTELTVGDCPLRELPFKKVEGQRADSSCEKFLPRLLHFRIWEAAISEISFGEGVCTNLRDLTIHHCDNLVEIGKLPNTLVDLQLGYCRNLNKIKGLSALVELQCLHIENCNSLEALPCVEHCISLKRLHTSDCWKLQLGKEVVEQLGQRGCHIETARTGLFDLWNKL